MESPPSRRRRPACGRQLDFTYDSGYASLPSPEIEGPQSMVADFDDQAHEDEQFDFQLT